jgi:hypothetical protein
MELVINKANAKITLNLAMTPSFHLLVIFIIH